MTATTFRKKPIEITAVQWTGNNVYELGEFTGGRFRVEKRDGEITGEVLDELHSTWVGVKTGQWVIRGVQGEFYPIAADVLASTYDQVQAR